MGTAVQTAESLPSLTTGFPFGDAVAGAPSDDVTLVRRCQEGDSAAFSVLYRRHCAAVRAVCRANTLDADTVDDMVQETFSRLWAAIPTFVGGGDVVHWLRRTAKNLCLDHNRRHRNSEVALVTAMVDRACATPDPAGRVVMRQAIAAVLAKLRPVDAALLEDHHLADRPLKEMARRWRSTEGSLSVRLTRARRAFAVAGRDLRALLPLPLWLRLRWSTRPDTVGAASTAGAVGVLNLTLALLLVLPPAAAGEFADTSDDQPRMRIEQHLDHSAPRPVHPPVKRRMVKESAKERPREQSSPQAPSDRPSKNDVVVDVPDAGLAVHRTPPERPDYRYSVDASVGPVKDPGFSMHKKPRMEPVNRPACDAVTKAPAVVTCSRGES